MNIFINNKPAQITLDTEKTLADVMTGIEQWISPTGNRILNIKVNDSIIAEDSLAETLGIDIEKISKLEVFISPWRALAAEALEKLHETCISYGKADFNERKQIIEDWEKSPAARFLTSDIPDLYKLAALTFSGEGLLASDFTALIQERQREIASPELEIENSETQVRVLTERMVEFPLDMQTGKDERAAETMQLFSRVGEKLFRIFFIYKSEGLLADTFCIDNLPVKVFMDEFNSAMVELSEAYKNQDTVLIGDIAEYEIAPRLLNLYTALKSIVKSDFPVVSAF